MGKYGEFEGVMTVRVCQNSSLRSVSSLAECCEDIIEGAYTEYNLISLGEELIVSSQILLLIGLKA
jgi:hypothetical protein